MIHTMPNRLITLLCTTLLLLVFLATLFLPSSLSSFSNTTVAALSSSSSSPPLPTYYGPHPTKPLPNSRRRVHFLLPATSTNLHACKTIFTGLALSYPNPILLGWGGHGRWNGSESHLFKFPLLDEYFSRLKPENDDDLVILLDAYDVWLQLPPEVLIKRYILAIEKENRRLASLGILDRPAAGGDQNVPIRNTILFGADRLCWPQDPHKQIPCWSSPHSLLPPYIFGPSTDVGDLEHAAPVRPRYLNSGTMIGTLKDVRDFWNATYDLVEEILPTADWSNKNSDQHYLHWVWNLQEEGRKGVGNGSMKGTDGGSKRREFGVTVDGEGDVFQESLYHEWVTWMRFNHSSSSLSLSSSSSSSSSTDDASNNNSEEEEEAASQNRLHAHHGRLDLLTLPSSIRHSPAPSSSLPSLPSDLLDWTSLPLGTNVLTGTIFPLFHITPQKWLRDIWWERMWFHHHSGGGGEGVLEAGRRRAFSNLQRKETEEGEAGMQGEGKMWEQVVAKVDGVVYVAVDGGRGDSREVERIWEEGKWRKGGMWSDLGKWMGWEEVCGEFEGEVFLKKKNK